MKTVRILLADDHKVVRQGTRALLSTIPEWEIVGEADNGRDAVALTADLKPDIVILDITMPELNGLDAARQIKRKSPETEILIFTAQETEKLVHDVFDSGARSYIMKTDAADHLIDAIKALSEHKHFFTSRISEIVFARCIQGKQALEGTPENSRITDREREIVQLLGEGKRSRPAAIRRQKFRWRLMASLPRLTGWSFCLSAERTGCRTQRISHFCLRGRSLI